MRAGGISVALDPSQPEDRLKAILSQTSSSIMVFSGSTESIAEALGESYNWLSVEEEVKNTLSDGRLLPKITPDNTLYIVFISGMTGTPKDMLILHYNFCSAISY